MYILVSFDFQASRGSPAFMHVYSRKVCLSHPFSVATWGRSSPESEPLFDVDPVDADLDLLYIA